MVCCFVCLYFYKTEIGIVFHKKLSQRRLIYPVQEDQQPNEKISKGVEQTLLQGGHTKGPETYERMLSITRDAN